MSSVDRIQLRWVGERHLRISCPGLDEPCICDWLRGALSAFRQADIEGLVDVAAAHATVLLEFEAERLNAARVALDVRAALTRIPSLADARPARVIEIPVCYADEFAPDLADAATHARLTVEEFVEAHSSTTYVVRFIGFAPGFGYLNGLPQRLALPRHDTPRTRVPAGSVGIAGSQTAIYPQDSPGGWRLIGRTPLVMFDARQKIPSLLETGDIVRMVPITVREFKRHSGGRA